VPFPGSDELIDAAENALGRRFPAAHRARLMADNGGEISAMDDIWQLFPVWDATDRRTVGRTANHIVRENEALRADWPDLLPGFIAIADNGTGDLLVLPPKDDRVHWYDHETGDLVPVEVDWNAR
jgi:hypothetical protein